MLDEGRKCSRQPHIHEIAATAKSIIEPPRLETQERFRFSQRKQNIDETPTEYMSALRQLALTCDFVADATAPENRRLRDKFIFGLASQNIQADLLTRRDLDVKNVVTFTERYIRTHKTAEILQGKEIINSLKQGSEGREKKQWICKFMDAKCYNCGLNGHKAKVCKKLSSKREKNQLKQKNWTMAKTVKEEFGMRLCLKKCHFGAPSVNYLGHIIDKNRLHTAPDKVEAVKKAPNQKMSMNYDHF
ncbi:hypothetical protein HELRODRAFT_178525 [Helobdella robusta]|uniref:CCHC-type domain-containing protein n=1 Tax=Helobdella robusta TaxID=6412 RepID=T1FDB1_HELRO|nr:hypothetical protein HELRODRAFT_178525 [Helobdella robusta]ESN97076.1 hypothetical protein HELRODRAFT_178525 [Helobdella robusta]